MGQVEHWHDKLNYFGLKNSLIIEVDLVRMLSMQNGDYMCTNTLFYVELYDKMMTDLTQC